MIAVESIHVRQGGFELKDLSFSVEAGSHTALMGQTGSGKTTLLEVICGLRKPQSGFVRLHGTDVTSLPPWARGVGYVPQDRALFATMSVRDNIGFAMRVSRSGEQVTRQRVEELAGFMGISHLLDRSPTALSGGEAGRVALARALAPRPAVLLLDEPLAALDEETTDQMVELIDRIRRHTQATVLHVTHRRSEADRLADQILFLEQGTVRSSALSDVRPAERFVQETR